MEILISEYTSSDSTTSGFNVTFISRTKKKTINDADFFEVVQLKRLLKIYFDAQV
jgi:hypothetical protein